MAQSGKSQQTPKVRLAALLEAFHGLTASLEPDEVMEGICRGVDDAFGLTSVDIYEYRPESEQLVSVWSHVRDDPAAAEAFVGTAYRLDEHPVYRRALAKRGLAEYHIDDEQFAADDPALLAEMRQWGEKSVIEASLVFGDEVMGLLSVSSTDEVLRLDDQEKELLLAFASTAATAIHNARLYRQRDEQARHLSSLLKASRAITSTVVLGEVLARVTREAVTALHAWRAVVYEYDPDGDRLILKSESGGGATPGGDAPGTVRVLAEHPGDRRTLRAGRPVVESLDDRGLAPDMRERMQANGEQTCLSVPLCFGGRSLGILRLSEGEQRGFSEAELDFAQGLGEQAAAAINNARLYQAIEEQAIRDGLTGLFNHRSFYERLQAELVRARRYGTPVSLAMIDVDDFKRYNDRHGHQAGDEVLRVLGELIARDVRRDLDIACRYGGEEFAVILPHTPTAATGVSERLRERIAATTFTAADGADLGSVTVSIGVAVYPGVTPEVDALVGAADAALYSAKSKGKNRVEVAPVET
jgi:diguanylate cyclase (GGDEF)-like protein